MTKSISRTNRRAGVISNYLGLMLILLLAYLGRVATEPYVVVVLVCLGLSIVLVLITCFRFYFSTGIWKLVHTKVDKLDERQIQVTHEALRYSYNIFTVVCLAFLLWKSVFQGQDPNMIIVFAVLMYLAHTLPASYVAWTEKEVSVD